MLDRTNLQCGTCGESYRNIRELAIHQLVHLTITIPFLQICPFCDQQSSFLAENLDHILDHLTIDKLNQSMLMKWLSPVNHKENSRLQTKNDSYQNFSIELPEISASLKCLYCDLFVPEKNLTNHVFEHLDVPRQKREHLRLWFSNFFKNQESDYIMKTYNNFVTETKELNTTSVLLEKLPEFENPKTNTCRYCKLTLANAGSLHKHYVEWHSDLQVKAWNCPICNFKETNSEKFVAHVYKKHLMCIFCRKKFSCFDDCCHHTKWCLRGCQSCFRKFLPFDELLQHLNGSKDLKCPYCEERKTESEQLKGHMRECCSRPPVRGVFCPLCKYFQYSEENEFKAHLLICKPWISLPRTMICSGIRQNQVPDDNFINLSDIEEHFSPNISDIIRNRLN